MRAAVCQGPADKLALSPYPLCSSFTVSRTTASTRPSRRSKTPREAVSASTSSKRPRCTAPLWRARLANRAVLPAFPSPTASRPPPALDAASKVEAHLATPAPCPYILVRLACGGAQRCLRKRGHSHFLRSRSNCAGRWKRVCVCVVSCLLNLFLYGTSPKGIGQEG